MYLFSKNSAEISEFKCDLKEIPNITKVKLMGIYPSTDTPLDVKYAMLDCLVLNVSGGQPNTTYSIKFKVSYSEGEKVVEVVVVVCDEEFEPLISTAPDAFMDLVGTMRAGESTVSTVVFNIPADVEVSEGYISWELINNSGEILSNGNAFSYDWDSNGVNTSVSGQCVIVCPSYLEPTSIEQRYQIRYTLFLKDNTYYQYETLRVETNVTVPLGAADMVELVGKKATVSIVLPKLYENCTVTIYSNNTAITEQKVLRDPQHVSSGWLYSACLNTSVFPVSLDSYDVVFEFWDKECDVNSEACKLWIINPSIRSAADDILAKIQKARASLYGAPDLIFTMPTVLTWMRRGRDLFNGWQGVFTNFTMTNAKGIIREYWLLCSEMGALEAQYMAEGEKAFDFSGAAISLNVDRTGMLQTMIDSIKGNLDQNLKPIKQVMTQKGYTSGDGSGTDGNGGIATSIRALGAVGLSITPASAWGRFYPGYLVGRAWV